jgi:hypothetical protein
MVVLGFELGALHLVGRCSTTSVMSQVPFLFLSFGDIEVRNQGLALAMQALYHLSPTSCSSPFCFSLFFKWGLAFAQGLPWTEILLSLAPS